MRCYAYDAASFSTGGKLPDLQFAPNHAGKPDVAMFDFTCMQRAENASQVREKRGKKLLMALVGDCLVEVNMSCDVVQTSPSSLFEPHIALKVVVDVSTTLIHGEIFQNYR